MNCPRCKRTLHRVEAQPVLDEEGRSTDMVRAIYECVQCDGYSVREERLPGVCRYAARGRYCGGTNVGGAVCDDPREAPIVPFDQTFDESEVPW